VIVEILYANKYQQRGLHDELPHAHNALDRGGRSLSVINWPSTVANSANLVRSTTVQFTHQVFNFVVATIDVLWQNFSSL